MVVQQGQHGSVQHCLAHFYSVNVVLVWTRPTSMISIEACRAPNGSFIMCGSYDVNRYYYVNTCLLLSFNVFEFVMLLSSIDLKLKCRCTDCSFCTSVLMDMLSADCCYFCSRVLILSGDVELNPGPFKSCPTC